MLSPLAMLTPKNKGRAGWRGKARGVRRREGTRERERKIKKGRNKRITAKLQSGRLGGSLQRWGGITFRSRGGEPSRLLWQLCSAARPLASCLHLFQWRGLTASTEMFSLNKCQASLLSEKICAFKRCVVRVWLLKTTTKHWNLHLLSSCKDSTCRHLSQSSCVWSLIQKRDKPRKSHRWTHSWHYSNFSLKFAINVSISLITGCLFDAVEQFWQMHSSYTEITCEAAHLRQADYFKRQRLS